MTLNDLAYLIPCIGVLSLIIYMGIVLCGLIPMIKILIMAIAASTILYKFL